ncbi:hypothetical protein EVJ58_g7013 [Rhodofomes roseus]|uniref:Uncharacterized protein n=1 Tax=Rhodofomes roseus TaxID=34475 RepID=A0A4Y9Y510_9APHY|nr:hypothetical protein EVJ58_g7013 [Rhodofomes roseus]
MSNNFAALPSRQVTFSRPANVAQQPYQQIQQQQAANTGLALPYSSNPYLPGPSGQSNLALPNAVPSINPYQTQQQAQQQQQQQQQPPSLYPQSQTQAQTQPQSALSSQTVVASHPARLPLPASPRMKVSRHAPQPHRVSRYSTALSSSILVQLVHKAPLFVPGINTSIVKMSPRRYTHKNAREFKDPTPGRVVSKLTQFLRSDYVAIPV